jgi:hypothetical protein
MRRAVLSCAVLLVACKRTPPPSAKAVWLAPDRGCAELTTDRVACWGPGLPAIVEPAPRAADFAGQIDASGHECEVSTRHDVACSGANDAGQLGDGTRNASKERVVVHGLSDVAKVGVGAHHTCALLLNGTVSCWGKNDHHQLSNGTTESSSSPVPVVGLIGVRELAVAGDGACVVLRDGDVRCWGKNDRGQLGSARRPDHEVPATIVLPR